MLWLYTETKSDEPHMHAIDIAASQSIDDFNTLFWQEMKQHTGMPQATAVDETLATLSGQVYELNNTQSALFFHACAKWLESALCPAPVAQDIVCNSEHLWGASVIDHTDNVNVLKKINVLALFNVGMSTSTQLPTCRLVNFLLDGKSLKCWEYIFSNTQVQELFSSPIDSSDAFFWRLTLTDKPLHLAIFLRQMENAWSSHWVNELVESVFERGNPELFDALNTPSFAQWSKRTGFWPTYFSDRRCVLAEGMAWVEQHHPICAPQAHVALVATEMRRKEPKRFALLVKQMATWTPLEQLRSIEEALVTGHGGERFSSRLQALNMLLNALPSSTLDGWMENEVSSCIASHPRVQRRVLANAINGLGTERKTPKM